MSSLDAAYNAANGPVRRFRFVEEKDLYDNDLPDLSKSALCPFDGSVDCKYGCMACDDGVRCCEQGQICHVTSQSMTPCPFASYMSSCMVCDNERGEPTLVASKPGDSCKATNYCTTFSNVSAPGQRMYLGSHGY
jgi:hypothetical protein